MPEQKRTVTDCTCVFCGANCDDLEIDVVGNEIVEVRNACKVGAANYITARGSKRLTTPLWRADKREEFQPISWEEAYEKAADIFINAKRPLLYGWGETSIEAMRVGLEITENIGGIFDGQLTNCHGPSIQAIQQVGIPTCTLGEVKNRADMIVYWGCNPLASHARHMARYAPFSRGFFRVDGRSDRYLVVIDPRRTDTAKLADKYLQVNLGEDYELFDAFRAYVNGCELEGDENGNIAGVPVSDIVAVADRMKKAKWGMIFFGLGLTHSFGKAQNVATAIELTALLNSEAKWSIMPMRGHFNVSGINTVCSWITGYPYGVDFSRGFPRYNVGEFTAVDLLRDKQVDAMFSIAVDPGAHYPGKCVERMAEIPLIACDVYRTPTTELANLILPGTHDGIECGAGVYRMDQVPMYMRKVVDPLPGLKASNAVMLEELYDVILRKKNMKRIGSPTEIGGEVQGGV
ncbi:MAG TPA: formylmethanofuran dehydrogenase subunit B [Candidatus Lokiarchaeia archaeon]|nr:formylmethanofuran dehydrogenase subunit B [Candidatus Lokiarchaeia archaeon]